MSFMKMFVHVYFLLFSTLQLFTVRESLSNLTLSFNSNSNS